MLLEVKLTLGPFSPLRQATQLATSNILQSKHVLTLSVGSNPEVEPSLLSGFYKGQIYVVFIAHE